VVIGSVTTSAALMLGGVALMVLPTLVVGNELLILGGVALAVGAWFLAHRHGQLRGTVAASSNAPGGRASPRAQTSEVVGQSPGAS
jgi:membrane-bound ClpP family serine protease